MARHRDHFDLPRGMALLLICNVAYVVAVVLLSSNNAMMNFLFQRFPDDESIVLKFVFYAAWAVGVIQLLYAIPLYLFFRRKRRLEFTKGIVVAAGITLFLSAGCFLNAVV